jgi:hypothetical protein
MNMKLREYEQHRIAEAHLDFGGKDVAFAAGVAAALGMKAAAVAEYFFRYKQWLHDNEIDDDTNSISVGALMDYVEEEIDTAEEKSGDE